MRGSHTLFLRPKIPPSLLHAIFESKYRVPYPTRARERDDGAGRWPVWFPPPEATCAHVCTPVCGRARKRELTTYVVNSRCGAYVSEAFASLTYARAYVCTFRCTHMHHMVVSIAEILSDLCNANGPRSVHTTLKKRIHVAQPRLSRRTKTTPSFAWCC